MKKFLFILSSVLLFILSWMLFINCCGNSIKENQSNLEQPQTVIITTDNVQYDVKWNGYVNVDVRIITLTKNNESHDYIIGTSYVGRGGGISLEHWVGCKCMKDSIKK